MTAINIAVKNKKLTVDKFKAEKQRDYTLKKSVGRRILHERETMQKQLKDGTLPVFDSTEDFVKAIENGEI